MSTTEQEREMPIWFRAWIHQAADNVIKTLGADSGREQAVIDAIWRKAGPYIRPVDSQLSWLKEFHEHVKENGNVCEEINEPDVGLPLCAVCYPDGPRSSIDDY